MNAISNPAGAIAFGDAGSNPHAPSSIMCGRFTLHRAKPEIIKEIQPDFWDDEDRYEPAFNIAPTMDCLVLTGATDQRRLSFMRWGLVPSWAKDIAIGTRMINARSETLSQKPSFRNLINRQHCAVLMDGYFEWQRQGRQKTPYLIRHKDHGLMLTAGLYDTWVTPEGLALKTFTIITADAAPGVLDIHDRMPAILDLRQINHWIHPSPRTIDLLGTYPGLLDATMVSPRVNSVRNNTPDILIPPPTQPGLGF